MKKTLIAAIAFAFAAVSFAAQTPAKPAANAVGQSTSASAKAKHHKKGSNKKSVKSTSPTK